MCDIEVCRICLRNHSKFYDFDDYNLSTYYEEITNKCVNKKDGLPTYFCHECAALLHKFHTFREKCEYGEKVLRDMLRNGFLTNTEIQKLNIEQHYKLKFLTLDILVSSKYVKTFTFNDSEYEQEIIKSEIVEDFTEGSFFDNDNFASEYLDSDPVRLDATLNYDVCIKEEEENSTTVNIAENTIETIHVEGKPVEKNNSKEFTVTNKLVLQNLDKPKQKQKGTKSRPQRKSKRINKQKLKHIDSDNENYAFELGKIKLIKSTVVLVPKTKKTYKFNRPRNSKKRHEFLNNSDNWKKLRLTDEEAIEEFQKKALDIKYLKAPYKCELCYLGFSQKSMLDRHIPRRHDESVGPAMCHFCKIRFKCQGLVNHHLRQHYNKYECLRCGLVCCVADSALLHEESHSGVKRKCPHCDKEFRHLSSFYTHLRTHRSKHICSLCGDSFVSELGLRQHRTIKHRAEMKNTVVDVEEAVYCEVCQINFESKDAYQNHLDHSDMHTDETKKKLGSNFVAEIVAAQEKIEGKDGTYTHVSGLVNRKSMVENDLCAVRKSVNTWKFGKKRNPQERIIKPKAPKVAKKPTACKHCNSTFETVKACMVHHQSQHRGKPFNPQRVVCEVCGASLAAGSVSAHMNKHTPNPNVSKPRKRTPTGKKTFTCDTCGHSFKTSNLLKVHQAKHTGERNYPCTLCDKRYTHSGSLSLHYRTIHLKLTYPKRNRNKRKLGKEEEYPTV